MKCRSHWSVGAATTLVFVLARIAGPALADETGSFTLAHPCGRRRSKLLEWPDAERHSPARRE